MKGTEKEGKKPPALRWTGGGGPSLATDSRVLLLLETRTRGYLAMFPATWDAGRVGMHKVNNDW